MVNRIAPLLILLLVTPLLAAPLTYTTAWVGNSYGGGKQWVLQDVEDIAVMPDGTLFTNVFWEEAGANVQQYGKAGELEKVAFHTHGWGYEGGDAVAANSKYLFIAQRVDNEGGNLKGNSWLAKGLNWAGVSRRQRSDIAKPAPFDGGHGKEGAVLPGSFLPVMEFPQSQRVSIRGLAASETRLFVSCPSENTVRIYDAETMKETGSIQVDRPDKIALGPEGTLWVLQRPATAGQPWKALHLDVGGKGLGPGIVFPTGVLPTDIAAAADRILVADAGVDQQVKVYSPDGTLGGTLGVAGGIFAGPVPGQFGDLRFNRPKGVGMDGEGNVYVASSGSVAGGSTVLESYTPAGKLRWRRMGLTFVDLADLDPGAETEVYTKEEHFSLDPTQPAGWRYAGYTANPFKYPDDPRVHLGPTHVWMLRLAGARLLFVTDMTGEYLAVCRFDPAKDGEIAIPCALFAKRPLKRRDGYPKGQPEKGEWVWIDQNGNGAIDGDELAGNGGRESQGIYTPDEAGTIWQINNDGIRGIPFGGLDDRGVPRWDYAKSVSCPKPAEFDQVRRLRCLPKRDVMILGGTRGDDKNQHWKPMGPVMACYDDWSKPQRKLRWATVLPYERGARGHESAEPISFDVAGDYLFVGYTRGLPEVGAKFAFVKILKLSDRREVGNLVPEMTLGEIGLLDLVESVRARRLGSGEYVVFLEDDYKAKVVMFRWRP